MELIDKQKLLEWLEVKIEIFGYGGSKGGKGEKWAFGHTKEAIERGRFDDHSAQDTTFERALANTDCGDCIAYQEEITKLKEEWENIRGGRDNERFLKNEVIKQYEAMEARAIQAEQERETLASFIRDMIRDGCWNIDGGDLQDKAEKLGFLRAEIYDPEKHGDDFDGVPGEDDIYVFAGLLEGSTSQ